MSKDIPNTVFYFTAPRKLEIRHEDCPPPAKGQVRCKAICSMISIGTEMICFARNVEKGTGWDQWVQYPFPPGYLSVGEIIDVGEGVEGLKPGMRVCSNSEHRAFFNDNALRVIPVPDKLPAEEACWFQMNIITQHGLRLARPVLGESAVVIGLGILGQVAVRLLGLWGLRDLIACDPLASRCDLARGHGPTEIFSGKADELVTRVKEVTNGRGADIVFDITGNAAVFHAAQHMLAKRGRIGLIGDVPNPGAQTLTSDLINKSAEIISAHGSMPPQEGNFYYRWGRAEMTQLFFEYILAGRINMSKLNAHRYAPEEAPGVYLDVLDHREKYMGVIFDWAKV